MKGIKLIISGMASSSIGIVEIPYSNVPLPIDGSDIKTFFVAAGEGFEHDVLIVSGVKTDEDVMRGEETQLIGCTKPGQTLKNELFIFPGTHSKHVWVKDGYLINFKTYMTGEVFALLTQHSILKNTVEQGDEFERGAFRRGVRDAVSTNILQSIFKVRTNLLFGKYTKSENYSYLSGLLVGTELQDLALANAETINLVCGHNLGKYYHLALLELLPGKTIKAFSTSEADEASVKGHLKISKQLKILE
jgi:2-dehydro-3-deoxygalactonokinase